MHTNAASGIANLMQSVLQFYLDEGLYFKQGSDAIHLKLLHK